MKKLKRKMASIIIGLCLLICGAGSVHIPVLASEADGWTGAWSTSPVEFNLKKMLDLDWIKCDFGL